MTAKVNPSFDLTRTSSSSVTMSRTCSVKIDGNKDSAAFTPRLLHSKTLGHVDMMSLLTRHPEPTDYKSVQPYVSKNECLIKAHRWPSPAQEKTTPAPSRWRLGLTPQLIQLCVSTFFGPEVGIQMGARSLVESGQMSPKEVVTLRKNNGAIMGKFLIREFPFYIQDGQKFVEFVTKFQAWLSSEKDLTPEVFSCIKDDSLKEFFYKREAEDGTSVFTTAQRFFAAENLITKYYKGGARVFGSVLNRFHKASKEYLGGLPEFPAERHKDTISVLEDLYSWIGQEYMKRQCDTQKGHEFSLLLEDCKKYSKEVQLQDSAAAKNLTIVHGDYNPGNILVDDKGTAKLIDFDDLHVDHPASDIAHALCQMMVFKFFDRTVKNRALRSELDHTSRAIGQEFVAGYASELKSPSVIDEIFTRLKLELPLALRRGTLLGILGEKIEFSSLERCLKNLAALTQDFAAWIECVEADLKQDCPQRINPINLRVDGISGSLPKLPAVLGTENQAVSYLTEPDKAIAISLTMPLLDRIDESSNALKFRERDPKELWSIAKHKIMAVVHGAFPGGNMIQPEYFLEKVDPLHRYGPDHSKIGFANWQQSSQREYFTWLQSSQQSDWMTRSVAYLQPHEAKRFLAQIINGKIVWSDDFPEALRRDAERNGERLLFTVDRNYQMFVSPKKNSEYGNIHHCSFTAGTAVRAAGFMRLNTDGYVKEIVSESGHFRPHYAGFRDVIERWHRRGALLPQGLMVQYFGDAFKPVNQFLADLEKSR